MHRIPGLLSFVNVSSVKAVSYNGTFYEAGLISVFSQ